MIAEKALSAPEVQVFLGLISSRISNLQSIAQEILVLCQRSVVFFCFVAPKETILFPFRCMGAALHFVAHILPSRGRLESKPLNVAEVLTGTSNPNYDDVCNASRQLCSAGINTILNLTPTDMKIDQYKGVIEKWNKENLKKIDELFPVEVKDLKSLSLVAKRLKQLDLDENQLKSIEKNLINMAGGPDKVKRNSMGVNGSDEIENMFMNFVLQSDKFMRDSKKIGHVLSKISMENSMDKISSRTTEEKFAEILDRTEKINNVLVKLSDQVAKIPKLNEELVVLRGKLAVDQKILKQVQGERDDMRVKLSVLEALVEDQESFLNNRKRKLEDSNQCEPSLLPNGAVDFSLIDNRPIHGRCPMQ